MACFIFLTLLILTVFPKSIVALAFPPPPKEPEIIRVKHHAMVPNIHSDYVVLDFIALVEKYGYPAEEYKITTEDGYKLTLHRIPGAPTNPKSKGKPVMYLQHGLLASSDTWVLLGPNKDLAFIAADAGYDVWLGNIRGNTYGRSHIKLSPDHDADFWRFSYHEIAMYDVPAIIDHILNTTEEESLIYIGHSMGTTMSYVLLSSKPEYNSKIRFVISLSPVAFWRHQITPVASYLLNNGNRIKAIFEKNSIYEIFPRSAMNIMIGERFCSDRSLMQPICISLIFQLSGLDVEQLNTTIIPYISRYFPAGASTQSFYHYHQNVDKGTFQAFDFGMMGNMARYKRMKPPHYNLSNIVAPVALIYGEGDILSTKQDVIELKKHLPNVVTLEKVPYRYFNHMDFIWARDAKTLLYDRIMSLSSKYRQNANILKNVPSL